MNIDVGYGWADGTAIKVFFVVLSAVAIPFWIFRMAKRFRGESSLTIQAPAAPSSRADEPAEGAAASPRGTGGSARR
jgi:hypothetical protein